VCSRILHLLFRWAEGGIQRGVCDVLHAGVRCAITLISLLATTVLWLGAASLDSFGDPAYCGIRDPVRGLHGGLSPTLICGTTSSVPGYGRARSQKRGSVDIFVHFGSKVDSYFCFLMSDPPVGW
jgi:hypothetical protein